MIFNYLFEKIILQGLIDVPVIFQSLKAEADALANSTIDSWNTTQFLYEMKDWFISKGWPSSAPQHFHFVSKNQKKKNQPRTYPGLDIQH